MVHVHGVVHGCVGNATIFACASAKPTWIICEDGAVSEVRCDVAWDATRNNPRWMNELQEDLLVNLVDFYSSVSAVTLINNILSTSWLSDLSKPEQIFQKESAGSGTHQRVK